MKKVTIRSKLLLLIGIAFTLTAVSVIILVSYQQKKIIDDNQSKIYTEKLENIRRHLVRVYKKLQDTQMVDAYEDGFKEKAISEFRASYYRSENQIVYPFIIDGQGAIVMHPEYKGGDKILVNTEFAEKTIDLKTGEFSSSFDGQANWYICTYFGEWDWIIVYLVPLETKYASAARLRSILIAIMSVITLLVVILVSMFITKFTRPITKLTAAARDIQAGSLNRQVDVTGNDEVGELSMAFNDMTDQLRKTLKGLETEVVVRKKVEAELKEHHNNLEELVHQRTTELTKANESLLRIKQAVESATDAIGISTPDGIHFYQNEAFSKMFGYESAEKLSALGGGKVLYADQSTATDVFHAIKAGGSWTGEAKMVRKGGGDVLVLLRADAIMDDSGKLIGLMGIHTDITDRKQAEEMLRAAKEEAESATRAKSEFLANMSHEIRTPMNGVIGMTGLLLGTELNAEQREYAETVRNSGNSLLDIINDILDYSKIEAGKLELEIIDFDLRVTVDEISDLVSLKAHEKSLEFINTVHHEVPSFLRGDPGRLRQVLINLVSNAIKFTKEGEVVVRASLENEDPKSVTLRFSVSDTGIGISKENMGRLFKSFSQADSSTTRKYGGTGLGLTISKQLVELMGGQIGIISEEGKGSEFWFTTVLEKQPEGKKIKKMASEEIKGKRILIVDDNDTNRFVLREQLNLWGCRYDEANSGTQALEKLHEGLTSNDRFEIGILDMQMPEMDGEMLGKKIKEDPDLKNTILIVMTSLGIRGDARRLKEIGFAAYLTKPVKHSYLYDCLATAVSKKTESLQLKTDTIVTRHSIAEDRKNKFRILLAEDNKINQKVALKTLSKMGYNADCVANGKEAVKALEMLPYDLVLMDCQMPEMDGYEATAEIRKPESKVLDHNVHVIALTANAMKGDREKCIEAGMDDYLTKPIKPKGLSDMLEKWLVRKNSEK